MRANYSQLPSWEEIFRLRSAPLKMTEGELRSGQSDAGMSAPLWTERQVDRGTGVVSTRSAQDGKLLLLLAIQNGVHGSGNFGHFVHKIRSGTFGIFVKHMVVGKAPACISGKYQRFNPIALTYINTEIN